MAKILAIDDKKDNLTILSATLKNLIPDCNVITAQSGPEGIEKAKIESPDTILLDIKMPGMDGYEVCKKLKEDKDTKHIPVIMISAILTESKDLVKGLDIGADTYLSKPVDRQVLIAQVKTALRMKTAEDTLRRQKDLLEEMVQERTAELTNSNVHLKHEIEERKQGEKKLRESEERYRMIFNNAPLGIMHFDANGIIRDFNDNFTQIMAAPRENILGFNMLERLRDKEMHKAVKDSLNGRLGYYEGDYLSVTGGKTSSMRVIYQTIIGEDGKFLGAVGIFEDITERKQAEEALRKSEKKYRILLETTSEGCWLLNPELKTVEVNQSLCKMLGYSQDEMIGKTPFDFVDDKNRKIFIEQASKISSTEHRSYEITLKKKNGQDLHTYFNATTIRDESGEVQGSFAFITDITKYKRIQEELNLLGIAIEQASESVFITDRNGTIQYVNPAFERLTGYSRKDAIGQNPRFLESGKHDTLFYKQMWDTLTRGNAWHGRFINKKKDGSFYETDATISPVFDKSGEITNFVFIKRDVTREVELEKHLIQAQKMEAIGTLAGGVAHDFNNILTTIIGSASLALMEVDKDGPLREEIEEIKTAGERASALTRQLLAFSRKQVVQTEILDFNKLLTDMEKMLGRLIGEDIEILMIPGPELWLVEVDPGQMEQIIMNLTINARDAMPMGGKITIETVNMDLDESYLREHGIEELPGSYVMLTVSDTGSGMDKKTQEHIFEPFYTTKGVGEGTGLGLSTVYGIVKQSNGFVWVYSEPGHGSTFKVYLPKAKGDVEVEEKKRASVSELGGSETVLIVEDDKSLRKLARTLLKQRGYTILEAENGEDALKVSKEHEGPIDLLITDVVMPQMSGKETAERLQPLYPHMKVIYMSGYTDNAIVRHGVLAPGLNFLEKPFSPEALARKVREVLDRGIE